VTGKSSGLYNTAAQIPEITFYFQRPGQTWSNSGKIGWLNKKPIAEVV